MAGSGSLGGGSKLRLKRIRNCETAEMIAAIMVGILMWELY